MCNIIQDLALREFFIILIKAPHHLATRMFNAKMVVFRILKPVVFAFALMVFLAQFAALSPLDYVRAKFNDKKSRHKAAFFSFELWRKIDSRT